MATGQKLYPRASLKKIIKAHSKRNLTKNVDVLVRSMTRFLGERLDTYLQNIDFPRLYVISRNVCRKNPYSFYPFNHLGRNIV